MAKKASKESADAKIKRAQLIVKLLKKYYPNAKCSLDYENPLQLLIATMLSAQCTDKRVNIVTPPLFTKYKNAHEFSEADISALEELVRTTGFYKNKAKNIKSCTTDLVAKYNGEVPQTMEELHALAGVGRKTANVVLGNAFGVPGMVVDTHVTRLTNRLGLAKGVDAVKLEQQLEKVIAKKDWTIFSHLLIEHGRNVCKARTPLCETCFLAEHCPKLI